MRRPDKSNHIANVLPPARAQNISLFGHPSGATLYPAIGFLQPQLIALTHSQVASGGSSDIKSSRMHIGALADCWHIVYYHLVHDNFLWPDV